MCLAWNWITPAGEGFDEPSHVAYVEEIVHTGHLPRLPSPNLEAHQPPVYYLLQAALLQLTGLPAPPAARPKPEIGGAHQHLFDHAGECHLCDGLLTLRIMRLVSTLLGLLTLLLVYATTAKVFPSAWWAVTGTATVAFIPQFQLMTSIVNNDALIYTVGAAIALVTVLLAQSRTSRGTIALAAVFGALIGAGLWTKEYAFALIPLLPLALLAATRVPWQLAAAGGAAVVVGSGIAGPLLWRDWRLYHELWPFQAERANIARILPASVVEHAPLDPVMWVTMPKEMWVSFWFAGGWGEVRLVPAVYWVVAAVATPLLAAGLVAMVRSARSLDGLDRRAALILMAGPALMYAGAWYSALHITQWPGRYLFPALAGVATWLTAGLCSVRGGRPALRYGALPCCVLVLAIAALVVSAVNYA